MKSIAKNPHQKKKSVKRFGLQVYFEEDDKTPATVEKAILACEMHGFNWKLFSKVYYLRGWRNKAPHDDLLLGCLEKGKRYPKELWALLDCLSFWNQEGQKCHQLNSGEGESYRDFILRCMACDCRVYVKTHEDKFITGTGANHIWVADKKSGNRILIFHF